MANAISRLSSYSRTFFAPFSFSASPTTKLYTLSLHDALPISVVTGVPVESPVMLIGQAPGVREGPRSEEHTSELQSRFDLVCRLLLEKKKPDEGIPLRAFPCVSGTLCYLRPAGTCRMTTGIWR